MVEDEEGPVALASLSLFCIGLIGVEATAASASAASPSCPGAVCNYDGTGYSGSRLVLENGVCGTYNNLTNQGWNDRISSVDNWVGYTQSYWKDANQKGGRLNLGDYAMVSNLGDIGFNNNISSLIWLS